MKELQCKLKILTQMPERSNCIEEILQKKKEALKGKGEINNKFNAHIMNYLGANGIDTHYIKTVTDNESLVHKLDMLPVECVVRNIATGSICRRLGVEQGLKFEEPLFEFFLKDDDLGDPLINDNHIIAFNWGTEEEIAIMKEKTLIINKLLCPLYLCLMRLLYS